MASHVKFALKDVNNLIEICLINRDEWLVEDYCCGG